MTAGHGTRHWTSRTVEIKAWKILVALVILPILVLWFRVVHQNDEILALVRNEVVTGATGPRSWAGGFVNTNGRTLRDVVVMVDFLDNQNRPVGRVRSEATELPFGGRLDLQAPLPADAERL